MILPEALAPMAKYAQFILFKLIPQDSGKTDKLPVDHRTLRVFTKDDGWQQDPTAWTTFEAAAFLAGQLGPEYGVGFFFTPADPFFFLDIDGCLTIDGAGKTMASPIANDIMARLPGAAIEVSQSGRGLHIFGQYAGSAPDHSCKNVPLGLELYTESRFVALTGDRAIGSASVDCTDALKSVVAVYYAGKGYDSGQDWTTEAIPEYTGPENDDELIAKACGTKSAGSAFGGGSNFNALWTADEDVLAKSYPSESGNIYDASSADAGLAQHLAFWTGKNCARILEIMKRSALVRDKWEREDYLIRTITRAVSLQETVYSVVKVDTTEADAMGAPKLRGSSTKQIEYAAQIRANKLAECAGDCDIIDRLCVKHGPTVDAKFWIDNKDFTAENLAAMVAPVDMAGSPLRRLKGPEVTAGYQFLGSDQQVEYFNGCCYIQDAHRVFTPSGALLKSEQFNATYGGYVFQLDDSGSKTTRKAFEAFTESQLVRYPKAESTCFRPDLAAGTLIERNGRILVNTYVPVTVERKAGNPAPFLDHLAKVLPVEQDRAILLAYMAACVQYKGVKFQWAPLLQGVEGNGKTLFTRCVAAAIGDIYVHMPPATEINEKFNAWLFDKLFIGVEDIYVPDQKREVVEVIKPMITNDRLARRAMQQDQTMHDVCCNFMFNSNHRDAVRKTENDRRFSIFYSAQQVAADLVRDGMIGNYFPDLYAWLRGGGYAIVTEFLHTYAIPDELNPATRCHRAPTTSSTGEAIQAGLGSVEQEILEAIDEGRPGFAGGWVSSMALEFLLKSVRKDMAIPINKRRDLLRTLGYDWHPGLKGGRVNNTVLPDNGKPRLFIRDGHISANLQSATEVAKAYTAAQGAATSGAIGSAGEVFGNGN